MNRKSPWHSDAELPPERPERGEGVDFLMELAIGTAIGIFGEAGTLPMPLVFAENADGKIMALGLNQPGSMPKQTVVDLIRMELRKHKAHSYVIAVEAWVGSGDDPRPPSQQPDRKEALQFLGEDTDGGQRVVSIKITRDAAGKPSLGERDTGTHAAGRFAGLLK